MEILLAVALMAALVLPIELLGFAPSSLSQTPDTGGDGDLELVGDGEEPGGVQDPSRPAIDVSIQPGLFSRALVQRRLDALDQELRRLDRDPNTFAKAFHTTVARSAYQALLVEAATLTDQAPTRVGDSLDVQFFAPSTASWEELEL